MYASCVTETDLLISQLQPRALDNCRIILEITIGLTTNNNNNICK